MHMAFNRRATETTLPTDPNRLYSLLQGDADSPRNLWWHQWSVLKEWHEKYSAAQDVALELPTGAGKTLVGGLIGEFRRRVKHERVAYLCPTKRLARQTYARLSSYGIPAVQLIGRTNQWNSADRARYTSGEAIAVTVYSHVFNSNPGISDAEFLIIDDAHAADGAVAGTWTIEINRKSSASYMEVLSVLESAFDPLVVAQLRDDTVEGRFESDVHLASPVAVAAASENLERVLRGAVSFGDLDDQQYSYRKMTGHLGRCMVYASHNRIQIRPFIPPTHTHSAFDSPKQRLYMSATLGDGGELERSFGRTKITRIPLPDDKEQEGTGRRFFCFPELTSDLAKNPSEVLPWLSQKILDVGRAVVMTPDHRTAKLITDQLSAHGVVVLSSASVEESLESFTDRSGVALVLANRYDGLDLPDDDCRLLVMAGLPARGDLQERFLVGALGAMDVLQERIRSRVVQGAGRATRNSSDFAAVLMLGGDLTSFCMRRDVREAMPPEINAELTFGIENSMGMNSDSMVENIDAFLGQTRDWKEVESEIVHLKDSAKQVPPVGTGQLGNAAPHEVNAYHAAWQGEPGRALVQARRALDAMTGGRAPQRYSALWNYLASGWALLSDSTDVVIESQAYYRAAKASGRGTLWLSHLSAPAEIQMLKPATDSEIDHLDRVMAETILAAVPAHGRPSRFDPQVTKTRENLQSTEASTYEEGLLFLGTLLGAKLSEGNGGASAAPDAVWDFSPVVWVAWEAKSNALSTGDLGAEDVRQAGSHLRFHSSKYGKAVPSGSISFLMTPQENVHPSSVAIAEDHVYLVRPHQVLELFEAAVRAWQKLRAQGTQTVQIHDVVTEFGRQKVLPSLWIEDLKAATGSHLRNRG